MMKLLNRIAFAAAVILAGASQAQPIVYTFSGTGGGTDGGVAFTNDAFTITATADTADVYPSAGILFVPITNASMTLAGFAASDTITPSVGIFSKAGALGLYARGMRYDLLDFFGGAYDGGYDLTSNFGPVTQAAYLYRQTAYGFAVDGQQVTFTDMSDVTFTAVTIPTGVPEPATWAMMLVGLGGLGAVARRDRKALAGV